MSRLPVYQVGEPHALGEVDRLDVARQLAREAHREDGVDRGEHETDGGQEGDHPPLALATVSLCGRVHLEADPGGPGHLWGQAAR